MNKRKAVTDAICEIPEPFLSEILDFVSFLKTRIAAEKMELATTSETSLKKDWLKPEEDEAWRDL